VIITVENTVKEARAQIPAQFLSSTVYISSLKAAKNNGQQQILLILSSCGGNKNYWFEVVVVNITVTVFYTVTSCWERQTAGSSKMLVHDGLVGSDVITSYKTIIFTNTVTKNIQHH
jgi:hypothetical protein